MRCGVRPLLRLLLGPPVRHHSARCSSTRSGPSEGSDGALGLARGAVAALARGGAAAALPNEDHPPPLPLQPPPPLLLGAGRRESARAVDDSTVLGAADALEEAGPLESHPPAVSLVPPLPPLLLLLALGRTAAGLGAAATAALGLSSFTPKELHPRRTAGLGAAVLCFSKAPLLFISLNCA